MKKNKKKFEKIEKGKKQGGNIKKLLICLSGKIINEIYLLNFPFKFVIQSKKTVFLVAFFFLFQFYLIQTKYSCYQANPLAKYVA